MGLGHAVVVGGSVAGLAAAGALAESFDQVTVVERDFLADTPEPRKGVPQGRQIHVAMPIGVRVLGELFPGFERELGEAGCPTFDWALEAPWFGFAGWRARSRSEATLYGFARPVFESVLRRRVRALANADFEQGSVTGLFGEAGRVRGVRVGKPVAREIEADLVVDASGRGSRAPKWLEELGYEPPAEQHVRAYFGYSSRLIQVPDGALPDGLRGLITMPFPGHSRGGLIMPADNGRHTLCCIGAVKDYPPGDEEGCAAFLREAPSPLLGEVAARCEPLTEIATYHHPGNQRRLWEELDRRPAGFIPIGDSVASFNPIYGQGMAVAAIEAAKLRDRIAALGGDLDSLPGAFMEDLREALGFPYEMATGADSGYPEAELVEAERAAAESIEFSAQLERAACADPRVGRELLQAIGWFDAGVLAAEDFAARVQSAAGQAPREGSQDPTRVPAPV